MSVSKPLEPDARSHRGRKKGETEVVTDNRKKEGERDRENKPIQDVKQHL